MATLVDPSALIAHLSSSAAEHMSSYAADDRHRPRIERALCIRAVESTLLDLFGKGALHGTVHTCLGQELIGVVTGDKLIDGDLVTSSHRCHGHFIGATGNWQGLIDEIIGNQDGVCAGVGSSQHLFSSNFISNGQQGGLLPVAAGIALDRKRRGQQNAVVSFIGEGTLGEGVVYETLNLDSLWSLPHLIVCENNFYSQSTPQAYAVAGDIGDRAKAFGIPVRECDTWNPSELDAVIEDAFGFVRAHQSPLFIVIRTYRLSPHSKGDDQRSPGELDWFREHDPLTILLRGHDTYHAYYDNILGEVGEYAERARHKLPLSEAAYRTDQLPRRENRSWTRVTSAPNDLRVGQQLNRFYAGYMRSDDRVYFLGEDVGDPYGGTFKVSKGLQSTYPDRVITTPISEAAITGVGAGLALMGNRPLVEIMFGDFITLAFDQIVNNASKFFHMYHGHVSCPMVVRTPMGGHRGYGPTHSQSLERFVVGIDNCVTISLNSLVDIGTQLSALSSLTGPVIVIENKVDYTLRTFQPPMGFSVEIGDAAFPTVIVKPERSRAMVSIVAYGGIARLIADNLLEIFDATDLIPELITPTLIHPIDIGPMNRSVNETRRLAVIEEGVAYASVGAELVAQMLERLGATFRATRLGGLPVPVPATPELERSVLPSIPNICAALRSLRGE